MGTLHTTGFCHHCSKEVMLEQQQGAEGRELFGAAALIFTCGLILILLPLFFLFRRLQEQMCEVLVSPWRCTECGVRVQEPVMAQRKRGKLARVFDCPCVMRPFCERRLRRQGFKV